MLPECKNMLRFLVTVAFVATVCFAAGLSSLQAHGDGTHDLALPGPLAHWDSGTITYAFEGQFPSNWKAWINAAATKLETDTFVDSLNENRNSSNNIKIGSWPTVLGDLRKAGYKTCDYSGKVGETIACAYPVPAGIPPLSWVFLVSILSPTGSIFNIDTLLSIDITDKLEGFAIVFDYSHVYQPGTTTVKPYWTERTVKNTSIHEFAHAVGHFDHIKTGQHVLTPGSGVFDPSYEDKWRINRLYLHSADAKKKCYKTDIDVSHAHLKMSAGKDYRGFLNQSDSNPCPSTVYDGGLAHYYKLDTSNLPDEYARKDLSFTISSTTSTTRSVIDAFAHKAPSKAGSSSPYDARESRQGGSRVAFRKGRHGLVQVATKSKYSSSYTLNVAPVCVDTSGVIKVRRAGLSSLSREWSAADCLSSTRPSPSYTDFYNLEVTGNDGMQIDLRSIAKNNNYIDTYLYIRRGFDNQSGPVIYSDDDGGDRRNARINLPAGSARGQYTIEATTYHARKTGNYALVVRDLTPIPAPIPAPPATATPTPTPTRTPTSQSQNVPELLGRSTLRTTRAATATATPTSTAVSSRPATVSRQLAVPTGLTSRAGYRSITFDWSDSAGAVSYQMQDWLTGRTYYAGSSSLTIRGLSNGEYWHRVRSYNGRAYSNWTSWVKTTLPAGSPRSTPAATATRTPTPTATRTPIPVSRQLAVPTGLRSRAGHRFIAFDWNDSAGAASYQMQDWFTGRTYYAGSSSLTIRGLSNGEYWHRVRRYNGRAYSDWTAWVKTTLR